MREEKYKQEIDSIEKQSMEMQDIYYIENLIFNKPYFFTPIKSMGRFRELLLKMVIGKKRYKIIKTLIKKKSVRKNISKVRIILLKLLIGKAYYKVIEPIIKRYELKKF